MRLRTKIILYVATWLLALFATNPDLGLVALAWMFPLGLIAAFDRHLANDGGWGIFIGCYVVYIVHAFVFFRSKDTRATWLLYAALVVLLVCNVPGCRAMINTH